MKTVPLNWHAPSSFSVLMVMVKGDRRELGSPGARGGAASFASSASTVIAGIALCMALTALPPSLSAALLTNGGFESGFSGWTRAEQVGSEGTFFIQSGTASPLNFDPVPAPPEGTNAAMTDAFGPGSRVLYQDFAVPTTSLGAVQLMFSLFIGNRSDDFFVPGVGLDFSTPALNQQARVDILSAGTDPFSVAAADVLQNIYQTQPGDPLVSGYAIIATDVTAVLAANQGNTLRLRFAAVDNVAPLQVGVDDVQFLLQQEVPEPSSMAIFGVASLVFFAHGWRRRSCRRKGFCPAP